MNLGRPRRRAGGLGAATAWASSARQRPSHALQYHCRAPRASQRLQPGAADRCQRSSEAFRAQRMEPAVAGSGGGGGGGGGATESVLNWVIPEPPPVVRPPRYRSQHDPLQPPYAASSTFVQAARRSAVGGIGRTAGVSPSTFLRAHAKTGAMPAPALTLAQHATLREFAGGRLLAAAQPHHHPATPQLRPPPHRPAQPPARRARSRQVLARQRAAQAVGAAA